MDRLAARLAPLGSVVLLAAVLQPVAAQTLQTLHVRSFDIVADRTSVRVGDPFHLTLSAHVDEPVLELDNVTLPDLSGFDVLGDERRCAATSRGTDCTETVTLAATLAGERTIAPVTMDAIDGRNRKASRFSSNALIVHVAGALLPAGGLPSWFADLVIALLRAATIVALVGVAAWALVWGFGRRRGIVPATAPSAIAPPVAAPDPHAGLRTLVEALAREPTRSRALALRTALRASFGARAEETLHDLRARNAASDGRVTLAGLAAVERAAFCEEAQVAEAVREALPFLRT